MNKTVETILTNAVKYTVIDVPLYENIIVTMILLFAVFANGLLIFLFLRDHRMHTPTNFFVMSHIVSEFFASCLGFCVSVHVLSENGNAEFLAVACVTAGCVNVFFFHTSFLSLTAIAVNRYLAVVKKIHHRITATKAKTIICLIWMLSVVVSLPWGWFISRRPEKGSNFLSWLVYCPRSSSIFDQITSPAAILKIFLALLFIGVPICVLLVCFHCILKSALRNRRRVSVSYNIHHVAADAYARSAFTTLLIIAVYLVCNAFMLPVIISPSTANSNPNAFFYRCIIWLRSATYPLVYTLRNPIYFRLLRRKMILISRYLCQSCPCCFKDERASYARPRSPAAVSTGAIAPRGIATIEMQQKLGRSREFQGASCRETSPLPASQQIRAWYLYKPKMAFTDLGNMEGNGTQKNRPRNEASPTDIQVFS